MDSSISSNADWKISWSSTSSSIKKTVEVCSIGIKFSCKNNIYSLMGYFDFITKSKIYSQPEILFYPVDLNSMPPMKKKFYPRSQRVNEFSQQKKKLPQR